MSIVINSNMAASYSALNMSRANNLLTKSLQRLSSGKRIVSPADDAGGLAVGMKLQSSLKRAAASRMNTQNGTSFLQMQDSVMKIGGEILDRMAELKSFFNDVSKNAADRETYNHEFHELQTELNSLKSQKFNGVSLFATVEPDNNPLKIITSDDGLGEHIELSRTGLFENLKSKFGADGVLNSGSNGEYRQLIGDFTADAGLMDADPGKASRAYKTGEVVYKAGASANDSGYFMALTDVAAGTRIEDTQNAGSAATSKWIRIADKSGLGFAESHPTAEIYNHSNIKYNSDGEQFSYLKGDVVKVQAHWGSPGSYFYMEAQTDVPRNISLEQMFSGNYVGANGYFNYVGEDSSMDTNGINKPTTDYVRTNVNFPSPDVYANDSQTAALAGTTFSDIGSLKTLMEANATNGYTPDFIQVGTDIYSPTANWDISLFDSRITNKEGDIVLSGDNILEFTSIVKGNWSAKAFNSGDYVFHDGVWHLADSATVAPTASDIPYNPNTADGFSASSGYTEGNPIVSGDADKNILVATSIMKGTFTAGTTYALGDVVHKNNEWYTLANPHQGTWNTASTYAANDTVEYNGVIYQAQAASAAMASATGDPAAGVASGDWALVDAAAGATSAATAAATLLAMGGAATSTAAVLTNSNEDATTANGRAAASQFFKASPWQHFNAGTAAATQNLPVSDTAAAQDRGLDYADQTNTSLWTKTHYGQLSGRTVSTSYTYGDNIFYQGKHYIYTSHLDSDDPIYVSPTDDGYTEFDDLLRLGAIRELPMYVDTVGGGGGAGLPEGIYYRPNQDLQFVDRLSNAGTVRTNSVERRTDAPLPPGDEIFNSADDQFYGGLNAGNDGIFGTLDDFYATTADPNIAMNGGHVDADADNNKDLLNNANGLENFSVADFVDYIQTLSNVRAVNGGTQSRLVYANRMLEENEINLGAATSRIMDADMAYESTKMAQQNVLLQAGASMVTQANQLSNIVLSLLQ